MHPLDPLSSDEINLAREIVENYFGQDSTIRFPSLVLAEPAKSEVKNFSDTNLLNREVLAVIILTEKRVSYELRISLSKSEVIKARELQNEQPPIYLQEFLSAQEAVKDSKEWQEAVRRRGVSDFNLVQIDIWSTGDYPIDGVEGSRRLARGTSYLREDETDNGYARPLENLIAVVDLNYLEVVKVIDGPVITLPDSGSRYDAGSIESNRPELRPLDIIQPEGPSFNVEGNIVEWQNWSFRVSLHPTDGLVLHKVAYEDEGIKRSVLYRASLSEMVVPYGNPSEMFFWRNAFDAGEYGIGRNTGSLELGCDCLGEIYYFDALMADDLGRPSTIKNAICMHEEDFSILWKHWDINSGLSEVRRSRRLVVSSIATLGNYDYGFYWYFYQDGHIEFETKLTGIVQTQLVESNELEGDYGKLIDERIVGINHQHIFNVRLDVEIDGSNNSVFEVDVVAESKEDCQVGNGIIDKSTLLKTELEAQREIDPFVNRVWKIVNPNEKNSFGKPVGFRLVPQATQLLLAANGSRIRNRAGFATKHLWVTPYSDKELHAGGEYPNQREGSDGLPLWTKEDRSIEDTDIVVWHTFGVSHVARPEDWPVMPVHCVGFKFEPAGFFRRNPSIDLPGHKGHCG